MENFSERLKSIRNKKSLTQEELAGKTGIEKAVISKFERNKKFLPTEDQLIKFSNALGVKTKYLQKGEFDIPEENLTQHYIETSRYIWNILKDSDVQDISIGEESITEVALIKLKKLIGSSLQVLKFSRSLENKNGADWEWIVIQGDKWLGFRIQAKRIFNEEGYSEYTSLHHKIENEFSTQNEALISNAKKSYYIPLYSFYNYLPYDQLFSLIPKDNIKKAIQNSNELFKESLELDLSSMGWSICYAESLSPTTEDMNKDFTSISEKSRNVAAFIGRDLQKIVEEYNKLFGNDGEGGTSKRDSTNPDGGGDGNTIESRDDSSDNKITTLPLNELPEYVKHRLSEVGYAFGNYEICESHRVHRVVISIMSPHPHTTLIFNEMVASPSPEHAEKENLKTLEQSSNFKHKELIFN